MTKHGSETVDWQLVKEGLLEAKLFLQYSSNSCSGSRKWHFLAVIKLYYQLTIKRKLNKSLSVAPEMYSETGIRQSINCWSCSQTVELLRPLRPWQPITVGWRIKKQ